jgi:acetyltransferase-like isoleucine patch superfamily enzyme
MTTTGRKLEWDWFDGVVPDNVVLDQSAYVETAYSFLLYRSTLPSAVTIGAATTVYLGSMFDLGAGGRVNIGKYALINGAWFICDSTITIGDHALISWNVVFMDNYRVPIDITSRRARLRELPFSQSRRIADCYDPRPITVGRNVWIGFDCCILPGVTIGDGAIVGARSVVTGDVPPYTVVAGNPARVIREIPNDEHQHAT